MLNSSSKRPILAILPTAAMQQEQQANKKRSGAITGPVLRQTVWFAHEGQIAEGRNRYLVFLLNHNLFSVKLAQPPSYVLIPVKEHIKVLTGSAPVPAENRVRRRYRAGRC